MLFLTLSSCLMMFSCFLEDVAVFSSKYFQLSVAERPNVTKPSISQCFVLILYLRESIESYFGFQWYFRVLSEGLTRNLRHMRETLLGIKLKLAFFYILSLPLLIKFCGGHSCCFLERVNFSESLKICSR